MGGTELNRLHEDLGLRGWYPLGIWALLHLVGIGRSFMLLGNTMMSYTPDFRCADSEDALEGGLNSSSSTTISTPYAQFDARTFLNASSSSFSSSSSSAIDVCALNCSKGWRYSTPKSHSFVAEWDVVCDQAPLKYLTETFFYLGSLFACTFVGYASDRFGRRIVVLVSAIVAGVIGCQAIWIPNLYAYLGVRFGQGIAYIGCISISTYQSEIFPAKWRFAALNLDLSFMYGAVLTPAISYLVPDWRRFCVIISCANFLAAIAVFLVPESPMWLIRKKRYDEAYRILARAAKSRGKELDFDRFMEITQESDGEDRTSSSSSSSSSEAHTNGGNGVQLHLLGRTAEPAPPPAAPAAVLPAEEDSFRAALRSRVYVLALVASGLMWSYNNFIYLGITFSYGTLSGDRLFNFLLNQLFSLPAVLLGVTLSHFLPRRWVFMPWYVGIGTLYFVVVVSRCVYGDVDVELPALRRVINVTLLAATWVVWVSINCFIQEAFPTLLRARSYSIACFCGRIVCITATFFPYLQEVYPVILETSVGAAGFCLGIFLLSIPETFRKPLPQSLAELEKMKRKKLFDFAKKSAA